MNRKVRTVSTGNTKVSIISEKGKPDHVTITLHRADGTMELCQSPRFKRHAAAIEAAKPQASPQEMEALVKANLMSPDAKPSEGYSLMQQLGLKLEGGILKVMFDPASRRDAAEVYEQMFKRFPELIGGRVRA